jgi:TPP-dependent pyruvate/acetoin dehydrogenase alpha subunit
MAEQVKAGVKQLGSEATQAGAGARQAKAGAAWENPLIPNARLRQIYRAMVQVRALARALPAAKRARAVQASDKSTGRKFAATNSTGTFGQEAALVSAAFDLGAGDLVSDALAGGVVDYLRGRSLGEVLRAEPSKASRKRVGKGAASPVAARLAAPPGVAERIWAALGAAAALKAVTAQARCEAQSKAKDKAEDKADATDATAARPAGVVVVYALAGEVPAGLWKKALRFAAEQELPVVFVVLPAARARGGRAKTGGVSALALGCGVPAIVVDADDAVAIYRVAQESIGHARIGGGAALMECVPFVPVGSTGKARVTQDAIAELERTMAQRGIANRAWMEREAKAFAKRVAR